MLLPSIESILSIEIPSIQKEVMITQEERILTTRISRDRWIYCFWRVDERRTDEFLSSRKALLFSPESNLIVDMRLTFFSFLFFIFINFPFETVPSAFISVYTSSSPSSILLLLFLLLLSVVFHLCLLFPIFSSSPPYFYLAWGSHQFLGMSVTPSHDVFPLRELLLFHDRGNERTNEGRGK